MKNLKQIMIAALLACNIYAGDSAEPTSSSVTYNTSNWPAGTEFSEIGDRYGLYNAVKLDNIMGRYYNHAIISGDSQYGLYTKSNSQGELSLVLIDNYATINSLNAVGVGMVGLNGQLNNQSTGKIFGNSVGVQIDTEAGNSLFNGFTVHNEGQIQGNLGIYVLNNNKTVAINNVNGGIISGKTYGILANNPVIIHNDNTILAQDKAAIYLLDGGVITNNGMIQSLATTSDEGRSIRSNGNLALKGNGSYRGDIEFTGNTEALSILTLTDSDGVDFKNSRLTNWGYIGIGGGKHYFNVVNDAQNSNYPRSNVYAYDNAYINTGAGGWGDADFTLTDNSLLNPYRNDHDNESSFYWDRPALKLDTNPAVVIYDRKEFEKLTVNDLTIHAGSGLVMDVRYSEPNYTPSDSINDEDDRVGYWDDMHEGVESIYNPDGSYAGQGYRTRLKKVSGQPGDLFLYQRVNYDTIDVKGTADISAGAKLHLLEKTKWMEDDGYIPEFVEKPLDHLEINLFDGNISLQQFDWNIDYYSDYYGIDSVDKENGIIHLTRDAYHSVFSGQKGQVDWWIKQADLGYPSSNPAAAAAVATQAAPMAMSTMSMESEQTTVSEREAAAAAAQSAYDAANEPEPTSMIGTSLHADSMARRGYVKDETGNYVVKTVVKTDDGNVGVQAQPTVSSDSYVGYGKEATAEPEPEVLPYQVAKDYNIKITDLAPTLELQAAISSFETWDDIDFFLDDLNKLEYASLTTSNLNAINNRVDNIYTQLQNDYLRDSNGYSFWFDTYVFDDSLQGNSNHDVSGNGYEVTAGFDKKFGKFTLGLSFNHTDYSTAVNDSGNVSNIDSDGYGLNVFAQYDQGKFTHRAIAGYGQQQNTDDVADFDSSEMFAAYRAEYALNKNVTLISGLRYATVKYDDIDLGDDNSIESEIHDSLQTELGVRLSKQFKKLTVNVSASWKHELLDTHNTVRVNSTYGSFNQEGITRDADSYRAAIGASYQLTEKMSIGIEAAKEMSAHSDSNSIAAKFRITF